MRRRARIVVIGSSNTDMVVHVPRIPAAGETVLGGDLAIVPGGKGANQAVAAARLGAEVTFVGCVGQDSFGRNSLDGLKAQGIDVTHCKEVPETPSGVALIAVDNAGQNAIVVAPGANMRVTADLIDEAEPAVAQADIVLLQCEIPLPTVLHAAKIARARDRIVVLNPAPATVLPMELLRLASVLTPNETEARAVLGAVEPTDEEATLRSLVNAGVKLVVLTLGARGALAGMSQAAEPTLISVAPFNVRAVDATAAGDCFTAALACAIAEQCGSSLEDLDTEALRSALRFASAAAALSVTRRGAQPSLPYRSEVEAFLSNT